MEIFGICLARDTVFTIVIVSGSTIIRHSLLCVSLWRSQLFFASIINKRYWCSVKFWAVLIATVGHSVSHWSFLGMTTSDWLYPIHTESEGLSPSSMHRQSAKPAFRRQDHASPFCSHALATQLIAMLCCWNATQPNSGKRISDAARHVYSSSTGVMMSGV